MTESQHTEPLRWGVIGPGEIAGVFATAISAARVGSIVGAFGRSADRRESFTQTHGGRPCASLNELLQLPDLDAVYIATPHAKHAEAVRAAIDADIPVLCEKPMTLSPTETAKLASLASSKGVFLAEAWMHRAHPQMEWLATAIQTSQFGAPRSLNAAFGFAAEQQTGRLFDPELGGGAIFDVGGYPISIATLVARAAEDMSRPNISGCKGEHYTPTVDTYAEATLSFASGFVARVSTSITSTIGMTAQIEFERALVSLEHPYLPDGGRLGRTARVTIDHADGNTEGKAFESPFDCYALEAQAVAHAIRAGQHSPHYPLVDHAESVQIATLLDQWRRAILPALKGSP